jgi:hypothetical protein
MSENIKEILKIIQDDRKLVFNTVEFHKEVIYSILKVGKRNCRVLSDVDSDDGDDYLLDKYVKGNRQNNIKYNEYGEYNKEKDEFDEADMFNHINRRRMEMERSQKAREIDKLLESNDYLSGEDDKDNENEEDEEDEEDDEENNDDVEEKQNKKEEQRNDDKVMRITKFSRYPRVEQRYVIEGIYKKSRLKVLSRWNKESKSIDDQREAFNREVGNMADEMLKKFALSQSSHSSKTKN